MVGERFPLVPLADVAVEDGFIGGPFGSSLGRRDYVPDGVPVVRGANLAGPVADFDETVYVTDRKADSLARCIALPRDITMTQRGTLGQAAVLPDDFPRYVISQSQMAVRIDEQVADARFVLLALRSPDMARQIRDQAIVTGVPHLNLGIFKQLEIPAPPLEEQRRIADLLGGFEEKLESNRRVVALCGAVASAFFEEHCVRRAAGHCERQSLADIALFVNGKNFTRDATGSGRPVLRIKELNSGLSGSTVWNEVAAGPDHVASHYDLLFAWSGTLGVYRWDGPEALVNQHIFKVVPTSYPIWWVECWLRRHLDRFKRIAKDKAVTMGHIRRGDLSEAEVLVPPGDSLARFDAVLAPVDQLRASAAREARALADVRDALLPKLVSGQIRVPADPDELVDSVRQAADLAGSTA